MDNAPHLRPEDRADFERVLDEALRTDGVRRALRESGARLNAEQLRTKALRSAAAAAAPASAEYARYTSLRDSLHGTARDRATGGAAGAGEPTAERGAGFLPAMVVITPVLAGVAAVVFLLLGYGLGVVAPYLALDASLVTAGWAALVIGALATLAGIVGLLLTAVRDSSTPPDGRDPALYAELTEAHDRWLDALLEYGVLPWLHGVLDGEEAGGPEAPSGGPAAGAGPEAGPVSLVRRRPRLGYTSPGFTSPAREGIGDERGRGPRPAGEAARGRPSPDFSPPEFGRPGYTSPDFTGPDRALP